VGSSVPRPTPNLEDHVSIFISPGDWVAQLYPQAPSTHFSHLLRHAWATVGLFFSPVTTRGSCYTRQMKLTPLTFRLDVKCYSSYESVKQSTFGDETQGLMGTQRDFAITRSCNSFKGHIRNLTSR